jgi:hypothetical protein
MTKSQLCAAVQTEEETSRDVQTHNFYSTLRHLIENQNKEEEQRGHFAP